MIKRLAFLMTAICAITFTNCSKSNDDKGGSESDLIGSWMAITDHDKEDGKWVLDYEYQNDEFILVFTNDGKVTEYDNGAKGLSYTFSYNASKKELTLAGVVCEVEKLTAKELVVIYGSFDADPVIYKTTYKKK